MPCIHGMYNNTMHDTADRVLRSYRACLDNVKESADDGSQNHGCGHPRYRTRKSYKSYGYAKGQDFGISRKGKKLYVRLGKVPKKLRLHGPGLPPGTPKTCTVSRDDMGTHFDYYVTITFLQDPGFARDEEYLETDTSFPVGIDVGISNAAAFSDGTVYRNTREYEKSRKRFEKLHRRFSETLPFTPDGEKALSRLNHCYRRLKNKRKDLVDRIAHDAVYLHDGIAMEALSVRQLRSISKSRRMTNQYNDASIGGDPRQDIGCGCKRPSHGHPGRSQRDVAAMLEMRDRGGEWIGGPCPPLSVMRAHDRPRHQCGDQHIEPRVDRPP